FNSGNLTVVVVVQSRENSVGPLTPRQPVADARILQELHQFIAVDLPVLVAIIMAERLGKIAAELVRDEPADLFLQLLYLCFVCHDIPHTRGFTPPSLTTGQTK